MKVKKLASHLAKLEAGKSQAKVGDKRQDVANLSDIVFSKGQPVYKNGKIVGVINPTIANLYKNGRDRVAKKIRKKRKSKVGKNRK